MAGPQQNLETSMEHIQGNPAPAAASLASGISSGLRATAAAEVTDAAAWVAGAAAESLDAAPKYKPAKLPRRYRDPDDKAEASVPPVPAETPEGFEDNVSDCKDTLTARTGEHPGHSEPTSSPVKEEIAEQDEEEPMQVDTGPIGAQKASSLWDHSRTIRCQMMGSMLGNSQAFSAALALSTIHTR